MTLEELRTQFYIKGFTFNRKEILALLGINPDDPNMVPVLGSSFKVRIGDENYQEIGPDVLIDDIRLIGKPDTIVFAQQLASELPDADLDFTDIALGKMWIRDFALVPGWHLSIFTESGAMRAPEGSNIDTLAGAIAEIQKILMPFKTGHAVYTWMRPANEIPEGFEEVTDLRGCTIIGLHPADPDFNSIGKTGGTKTVTLAEQNVPEHRHFTVVNQDYVGTQFPDQIGRFISKTRALIASWNKTNGAGKESYTLYGASGEIPSAEPSLSPTSKSGAANPVGFKVLNPYRVVMFIRLKTSV